MNAVTSSIHPQPRVAVVTGGARGLGVELTLTLLRRGFKVAVGCRDQRKAQARVATQDRALAACANFLPLDLASLQSTVRFASDVRRSFRGIDVLVNNAAVCRWKDRRTVDGLEESLSVNYLGPFVLTAMLGVGDHVLPRVHVLNIGTHTYEIDALQLLGESPPADYDMGLAYRGSKMLLRVMTEEFNARYGLAGLRCRWRNPGLMRTGLGADSALGAIGAAMSYPFAASPTRVAKRLVDSIEHELTHPTAVEPDSPLPKVLAARPRRDAVWTRTLEILAQRGIDPFRAER